MSESIINSLLEELRQSNELIKSLVNKGEAFEEDGALGQFLKISDFRSSLVDKLLAVDNSQLCNELQERKNELLIEVMNQDELLIKLFSEQKIKVKKELIALNSKGKVIKAYKKAL